MGCVLNTYLYCVHPEAEILQPVNSQCVEEECKFYEDTFDEDEED